MEVHYVIGFLKSFFRKWMYTGYWIKNKILMDMFNNSILLNADVLLKSCSQKSEELK